MVLTTMDANTARILLSLLVAFHNVDVNVATSSDRADREALILTEEEADLGLAIIETEFDCDLAAVGRALANNPHVADMMSAVASRINAA